jgi:hypothetical protein
VGLFVLLGKAVGLTWRFIRATFPSAANFAWEVFKLVLASLSEAVKGWLPTARFFADQWTADFINKEILTIQYDRYVWYMFFGIAVITPIVIWIILAYLTVFILGVIF